MALITFFVLVILPIIEISVFFEVGHTIGLGYALLITLSTAFAGSILLRLQGLSTLLSVRMSLEKGEMPLQEFFSGACIIVAGLLLLTPGFVTDGIGLSLFFPPFRFFLWQLLRRKMMAIHEQDDISYETPSNETPENELQPTIIDVSFRDKD